MDWFGGAGKALSDGFNWLAAGTAENTARAMSSFGAFGGDYDKFKAGWESFDPQRDKELGGAPYAADAATFNKRVKDDVKAWGALSPANHQGNALRSPWTNQIVRPGEQGYDQVADYYKKLDGYGSAGTGGQKQAAPFVVGSPAAAAPPPNTAPQQGNVHGAQGLYGGVTPAPKTRFEGNPYFDQLKASMSKFEQRQDALYGQVQGIENAFDPNSELYKKTLANNIDAVTRNFNGAQAGLAVQNAQHGRAAGGDAQLGNATLDRHRRMALADTEAGLARDAMANQADFALKKAQALSMIGQGDLATAGSMYRDLLGLSMDEDRYDRDFAFREKRAAAEDSFRDKSFDAEYGAGGFREQSLDLQRQAMDIARTNQLDANETEMWGNIVQTIPGVLEFAKKSGIGLKEILAMFGGGQPGSPAAPAGGSSGAGPGYQYDYGYSFGA